MNVSDSALHTGSALREMPLKSSIQNVCIGALWFIINKIKSNKSISLFCFFAPSTAARNLTIRLAKLIVNFKIRTVQNTLKRWDWEWWMRTVKGAMNESGEIDFLNKIKWESWKMYKLWHMINGRKTAAIVYKHFWVEDLNSWRRYKGKGSGVVMGFLLIGIGIGIGIGGIFMSLM